MSDNGAQLGVKNESLYFTDGNVVLLAPRPDQPAQLFRVHRSVLSSHSPIFSDMFDVCNTSDMESKNRSDHLYDGVPLIHMPDDADHLESVLKILYYQSPIPWTPHSPQYPELITPILELSRKYGIDRMRDQIVKHLETDWPQTLQDWERQEREIECMVNNSNVERVDDHFPEPASAIKLAQQFDIPSILPAAFYHLSRLSVLDDWDKTHADPSLSLESPERRTAKWELLSAKDFHCLLLGKAEIEGFLRGCINTGDLRHMMNDGRRSLNDCDAAESIWNDICDLCSRSPDPLALLKTKNLIGAADEAERRCYTCAWAIKAKIQVVRERVWEKLGDIFHLDERV